jgi:hypothetical protein
VGNKGEKKRDWEGEGIGEIVEKGRGDRGVVER